MKENYVNFEVDANGKLIPVKEDFGKHQKQQTSPKQSDLEQQDPKQGGQEQPNFEEKSKEVVFKMWGFVKRVLGIYWGLIKKFFKWNQERCKNRMVVNIRRGSRIPFLLVTIILILWANSKGMFKPYPGLQGLIDMILFIANELSAFIVKVLQNCSKALDLPSVWQKFQNNVFNEYLPDLWRKFGAA